MPKKARSKALGKRGKWARQRSNALPSVETTTPAAFSSPPPANKQSKTTPTAPFVSSPTIQRQGKRTEPPGRAANRFPKRLKISPSTTPKSTLTADRGALEIFIQLEQMDDNALRQSIRSIRKKLQQAVDRGSNVTDPIEIHDDDDDQSDDVVVENIVSSAAPGMAAPVQDSTETTEPEDQAQGATEENAVEQVTLQSTSGERIADAHQPHQANIHENPIQFTRWTIPSQDELITIRPNAFDFKKCGGARLPTASRKAKARAVVSLLDAVSKSAPTMEQQGLALRLALLHPRLWTLCFSAGIHVSTKFFAEQHIMENIRYVVKRATKTKKRRGRATDDLRSVVHSIVLASLPRPGQNGRQPPVRQLAKAMGLSLASYHRIRKAVELKRAALESVDTANSETIFSQVLKRKGWKKLSPEKEKIAQEYIRNHPQVVTSPIANDLVTVPDESDPTKTRKTAKLLLQIPIRELHNDLIAELPEATGPDGKILISDWKLRQIMPPEVRPMTNRYKTMCGCITCISMQYLQSDLNRYKTELLKKLKKRVRELPLGSDARRIANARFTVYKNEICPNESVKDASNAIQCKFCNDVSEDPTAIQFEGLTRMRCAYGNCDQCPKHKLASTEEQLTDDDPKIWFHSYPTVASCSEHGALPEGTKECRICSERREGETRGNVSRRRQLVHKKITFPDFYKNFYLPSLTGYKKHRFKFIMLSKSHTAKDRENIRRGEVQTQRDFSERASLSFNNQVQLEYYGGGATVSLEGVMVMFFEATDGTKTREFHTYLADGKQQDSAVVHNHMAKLIEFLKKQRVLMEGGHLYCHSDGCAAQYRCATAYWLLSQLASIHSITIDRFISAPGHGKSIVDGISGKTKTRLMMATARENKKADEAEREDVKKFNPVVIQDGVRFSAAKECKRMLEIDGTTGAKSNRKYRKREEERGIRKMHYHVRDLSEQLTGFKAAPMELPKESGGVGELYHIYCSHEMGVGNVALRRIPCACPACKATIKMAWVPRLDWRSQPRFQPVPDCKYKDVLEDSNKWYFATINQRDEKDPNHCEYMDEEADLLRKQVRDHISAVVADEIKVGGVGAVVTTDEKADGYYLIEWTDEPFTCQETGELKCRGKYFNRVGRVPKWYTKSDLAPDEHLLQHVVSGAVEMEPISVSNPLPNHCNKVQATRAGAMKISKDSDDFIFDEIWRRDLLEDPEYDLYEGSSSSEDESDSEDSDSLE